jgi:hypothetical protein
MKIIHSKLKQFFEERNIDYGLTDTHIGHLESLIQEEINQYLKDQKKQLVGEIEEVLKICQKIKEIEHKKMNTAAENQVVYDISVVSWVQNIEARLYSIPEIITLIEKNV